MHVNVVVMSIIRHWCINMNHRNSEGKNVKFANSPLRTSLYFIFIVYLYKLGALYSFFVLMVCKMLLFSHSLKQFKIEMSEYSEYILHIIQTYTYGHNFFLFGWEEGVSKWQILLIISNFTLSSLVSKLFFPFQSIA